MGNMFVTCLDICKEDDLHEECIYCKLKSPRCDMKCNICKAVFHNQCYLNTINKCPVCNADGSILIREYVLK